MPPSFPPPLPTLTRGKLLNIGFDLARSDPSCRFDVFIFHDVDLLPSDNLGTHYSRFPTTPLHIARCWDRYSNNPKYFGGIVSFNSTNMKSINGFPNTFWGWGGEDDEMQKRCEKVRSLVWRGLMSRLMEIDIRWHQRPQTSAISNPLAC